MSRVVKVGTRKSDLALVQTNFIIEELKKVDKSLVFEIVKISTKGDEILDKPLIEFGGKGVFIDEFEKALLNGEIDLAVHSAKDMPMDIPNGLSIVGVPLREDARDVLISLEDVKEMKNFKVGTSSLRRQLQVKSLYNVECESLRGNVPTRLNHLRNKKFDAIILASAGLKRLNLDNCEEFKYKYFSTEEFIPASCQGILAVEGRIDDELRHIVAKIDDKNTRVCLETERSVLKQLNSSCHEPVGAYAYIENDIIYLSALYETNGQVRKVFEKSNVENRDELVKKVVKGLLNNE